MRRFGLIALCALALGACSSNEPKSAGKPNPAALQGSPAPLASLHRQANELLGGGADGFKQRLQALRGYPVVVNKWASWCPPCVEETPSLLEFSRQLGPQGVVVLGISNDRNEGQYRRFLQRFHIDFETSRDPENNISASYGTFQLPETYLIDRNGRVVEKVISNQNWMDPQFLARVKSML